MEGNRGFDLLTIQQYLDGKLDPKRMHQLEKQALDDPFLADAIEGYAHAKKPVQHELSILQRQLEERIAVQQENKNIFNFTWQRLSIAAAAGLMFITVGILFWMSNHQNPKTAAVPKKVDVEFDAGLTKPVNKAPSQTTIKPKDENAAEIIKSSPRVGLSAGKTEIPQNITEQLRQPLQTASANPPAAPAPAVNELTVLQSMPALNNSLSGRVMDKIGGQPLPGVSVKVNGTDIAIQTDAKGEFTLPDTVKGTINVSFLGYESKELEIKPGQRLAVLLDADQTALNEVVVTASGLAKRTAPASSMSELNGSQPSNGWDSYWTYLERSLNYPKATTSVSGDVIVGFTIDSKGRPTNVHIIQGLNASCDQEAIRLIRQGPDWEITDPKKPSQVRVTINFHP
jgi:TonB family protein